MNAARKLNNKETKVNTKETVVEEKSWREKMAEELLIADAAAKDKAEQRKAKELEKKHRKELKRAEKETRRAERMESFKEKVAIAAAVATGAGAIAFGMFRHHADSVKENENDDKIVDVDFTEVKEEAEEKSEE